MNVRKSFFNDRASASLFDRRWPSLALAAVTACIGAPLDENAAEFDPDSEQPYDESEIEGSTQALYGNMYTQSCDANQKAYLRNTLHLGRMMASSAAFEQCMDLVIRTGITNSDAHVGPYKPCSLGLIGDPYRDSALSTKVSKAVAAARSTHPLSITCAGQNSADVDLGVYVPFDFVENINFKTSSPTLGTTRNSYAMSAGLLWHEAIHQQGYGHDNPEYNCGTSGDSMPEIVQVCVQAVSDRSEEVCGGVVCPGAQVPVATTYPLNASTGCACVRDSTQQAPVLGNNAETQTSYGYAMAAGDFDGDKFTDLAIGAPAQASLRGAVYLYRGTEFGLMPWKMIVGSGTASLDRFGWSLAAGDLNGDGLADLAVGAPSNGVNNPGYVYLYRGHAADGLAFSRKLGQANLGWDENEDQFGSAVAIGRIFGPGLPGLVVGAPGETLDLTPSGSAMVFEGVSNNNLVTPRYWLRQDPVDVDTAYDRFGESIAIGAFNPASETESFVIGAPNDHGSGRAYVYLGTGPGAVWNFPLMSLSPPTPQAGMRFGHALAVAKVGDVVSGAAEARILVGAPNANSGKGLVTAHGLITVLPDNSWAFGAVQATFEGTAANGGFGTALHTLRLTASEQVLVGAPNELSNTGGVYRIIRATSAPLHEAGPYQTSMDSGEAGDMFGAAFATGDFNYDGKQDVMVGLPGEAPALLPQAGAVMHWNGDGTGALERFHWYHKQM